VKGITSLSMDPSSGLLYGIIKTVGGTSGRRLATIDPITGVATDVGALPDGFANIEFAGGALFGVTGDGAPVNPESLFSVSTVDASTVIIQALRNGDDGESIAFNTADGLMYHWSGFGSLGAQVMETIDLGTQAVTNVPTDFSSYEPGEIRGSTYDPWTGDFLFVDANDNLGSVTPGGVFSLIGALPPKLKALGFHGGVLRAGERARDTIYALDPVTADVSDLCDPDEMCPGVADATCPVADVFEPATTVCRAGSGDLCDPDELCPGVADAACPGDIFQPVIAVCNAGSGDLCDPDEVCPGVSGGACPAEFFEPATTVCNAGSGDLCDPDELCPGVAGAACPADDFEPATTICNPGSASVVVTLAGFSVKGFNSLSTDPGSGLLYGIVKTASGNTGRRLATIDPDTGVATDVGPLPDGFANIEFSDSGLYGVTGDGAPANPESLFTVSTVDASTVFVQLLGNGNDGESIAFNPADGLMYHWSGFFSALFQIMETVDLSTQAVTNIPLDVSSYNPREVFGSTHDPSSGNFLFTDHLKNLGSVTPGGVFSLIGALPASIRGVAFKDGKLYGAEKSGDRLYRLNPSSGSPADVCDPDELCPGVAGAACPADVFEPATTVCQSGSGDLCDPDELCPGLPDGSCPAEFFEPVTTVCRPGSGDLCDPDELCPGLAGGTCPADFFEPAITVCNPGSGDLCDPDELCPDLADGACPADFFEPATTVCNPGSGDLCDPEEVCTGIAGELCPPDFVEADGTACPDGNVCNGDDICESGSCAAGAPLDCDDLDVCTADGCDEVSGCFNDPIPACGAPIPTVSSWGRALVVLFLLAAGVLTSLQRRFSPSAGEFE
jgi:hypothetical protein